MKNTNNSKIDELYDRMLEAGDMVANGGITKEFINELKGISKDTVEALSIDQEPDETIKDIEVPEQTEPFEGEKVITTYNPENGEVMVSDKNQDVEKFIDRQFDALSDNEIDFIKSGLTDKNLDDINALKIAGLVSRRMHGETTGFYDGLPDKMKITVNQIMMQSNTNNIPSSKIVNKNYIARCLVDEFVKEIRTSTIMGFDLDSMLAGFDKEIENFQNNVSAEMGGMMMSFDDDRKASIDAAIKRCEEAGNTDGVSKLQLVKNNIDTAFKLDDFKEFCKNCKIKNFETKKTSRIFDPFNAKYQNHKNVINDIRSCPAILSRHLKNYSDIQVLIICLAFCKYCANMSPDNMDEHTFMYYFIRNIILIDRINPKGNLYESMDEKSKAFYDGFTKNLSECIDNLLERNPSFKIYNPN